jgi:Flp pilus assembly pilin Flp
MHHRGATGSEHGLIAGCSALVIPGLMTTRGTRFIGPFRTTAAGLP